MSVLNNLSLETCSIVFIITLFLCFAFATACAMFGEVANKKTSFFCVAMVIINMLVCSVSFGMCNATTIKYSEITSIESSLDENEGMTYTITLENGDKYTLTDYKVVEDRTSEISYAEIKTHTLTHKDGSEAKSITVYLPSNEYYDVVGES